MVQFWKITVDFPSGMCWKVWNHFPQTSFWLCTCQTLFLLHLPHTWGIFILPHTSYHNSRRMGLWVGREFLKTISYMRIPRKYLTRWGSGCEPQNNSPSTQTRSMSNSASLGYIKKNKCPERNSSATKHKREWDRWGRRQVRWKETLVLTDHA